MLLPTLIIWAFILAALIFIRHAFADLNRQLSYYRKRSVLAHKPPKETRATRWLQTIFFIPKNCK